jgi:uncharacterized membrane protein
MVNRTARGAWAGWVIFAGSLLLMIGAFNVIEGLVAIFDDKRVLVAPERLIVVDLTGWGWTLLLFGVLMIATGLGLIGAQTWARVTAIVLVGLHAAIQVAWLGAYPVWSLLMIALDVVVLYALTARWSQARSDLDADATREDRIGQHTSVG